MSVKEKTFWFLSTVQQETGFSVTNAFHEIACDVLKCVRAFTPQGLREASVRFQNTFTEYLIFGCFLRLGPVARNDSGH